MLPRWPSSKKASWLSVLKAWSWSLVPAGCRNRFALREKPPNSGFPPAARLHRRSFGHFGVLQAEIGTKLTCRAFHVYNET
jgi:hypothetical protein